MLFYKAELHAPRNVPSKNKILVAPCPKAALKPAFWGALLSTNDPRGFTPGPRGVEGRAMHPAAHHAQHQPRCDEDENAAPPPQDKAEDETVDPANTAPDQALWRYHQKSTHGRDRTYSGHVMYIGGAEGQRLQGELATAIRDLLAWAVVAARNTAEESADRRDDSEAA